MAHDKPDNRAESRDKAELISPLQQANLDSMVLGKRALPVDNAMPKAFTGKDNTDFEIVNQAKAHLGPERVRQLEEKTDRWKTAIAELDAKIGLAAKPGDSLSKIANTFINHRENRNGTAAEIAAMVKDLAKHNGKSDPNDLKVGEVIRALPVPPRKIQA